MTTTTTTATTLAMRYALQCARWGDADSAWTWRDTAEQLGLGGAASDHLSALIGASLADRPARMAYHEHEWRVQLTQDLAAMRPATIACDGCADGVPVAATEVIEGRRYCPGCAYNYHDHLAHQEDGLAARDALADRYYSGCPIY